MNDIILTAEQAQQIETALVHSRVCAYKYITQDPQECTCGVAAAHATIRAAKAHEQMEQEPVACPDKGLWTVKQWGTDKVVLLSGDFIHDVALTISGDFLDNEQRLDYALNLASWMNHHLQNAAPVRTKDLTDAVDAAMVEMQNIHPPLRRSECERLIRAANYASHVRTKDLTDDEIRDAVSHPMTMMKLNDARAVIAKLKEKTNG